MSAGRAIAQAVRAASRNAAVRRVALLAATEAGRRIGPVGARRWNDWRDRRQARDRAIKLARQIGGRYSADTIIGGEPHFVVWRDGQPVEAFPPVADLAARSELHGFDARLTHEPPPPGRRFRPPNRGPSPG